MRKRLLVIFSLLILGVNPTLAFAVEPVANTANPVAQTTAETTNPTTVPLNTERKAVAQELKSNIIQARTTFQEKIAAIKDEHKKTVATNIDAKVKTINDNRTKEMLAFLDRLTGVLTRISSREATLKSQGKATTSIDTGITSAQAAIDTAKTAVNTQAAKTYTIQFTDETNLGQGARAVMLQFRTDLKTTFEKVVAAQKAVVSVYKLIGQLMGETVTLSASPSPSLTVTPTQ